MGEALQGDLEIVRRLFAPTRAISRMEMDVIAEAAALFSESAKQNHDM